METSNAIKIAGRSDESIRLAFDAVNDFIRDGDILLLKGSRSVALERLLAFLKM